ncbi:MAG: hypothetical protein ACKO9Z_12330 [Planctomycetota bacterium]
MNPIAARWYFLALAVAGLTAAFITWMYANRRQLSKKELQAAKELWCSRHILDYDIKLQVEDGEKRVSLVRVRKGSMTDVMDNGRFVESGWDGRDVRGLFKVVEELLALKSSADYLVADFHPDLGFPIRVVWRPRVGMRREWIVRMDFPDVH